jgi:hypothetical protein
VKGMRPHALQDYTCDGRPIVPTVRCSNHPPPGIMVNRSDYRATLERGVSPDGRHQALVKLHCIQKSLEQRQIQRLLDKSTCCIQEVVAL